MEYRGIQYQIVQTANPAGFKWTVQFDADRTKTGQSKLRRVAVIKAQRSIERELGPETLK
jgi:hypothetical protein